MVGRKKQNITMFNILNYPKRKEIYEVAKEPMNFTNLKIKTNSSSASLDHHLKILEKFGMVTRKIIEIEGKKKQGNETLISSSLYEEVLKKFSEKKYNQLVKDNKDLIKDIGENKNILKILKKDCGAYEIIDKLLILDELEIANIIKRKYVLTEEGKKLI